MSWIESQEKRTYRTYKARIRAADRLRSRGVAWVIALISASTAASVAGIGMIADAELYGQHGSVAMAAISVLTLVASLVVTGVDYESRHRKMFDNYRKLQRLSTELEFLRQNNIVLSEEKLGELRDRYQDLLDESENHSILDNMVVERRNLSDDLIRKKSQNRRSETGVKLEELGSRRIRRSVKDFQYYSRFAGESVLTLLPYAILVISASILIPVLRLVF